jgi:hypothetical protein
MNLQGIMDAFSLQGGGVSQESDQRYRTDNLPAISELTHGASLDPLPTASDLTHGSTMDPLQNLMELTGEGLPAQEEQSETEGLLELLMQLLMAK